MKPRVRRSAVALLGLCSPFLAWPGSDIALWPVAGRQGLLQMVIVPQASAGDRAAYEQQIERLCQPDRTCFLNFYTNSSGAELTVPLPDAISHEATAVFRRSSKQGAESLRFSCRLQLTEGNCF
jgi:hypothetical protein